LIRESKIDQHQNAGRGEEELNKQILLACSVAAVLVTSPSAYSGPGNGTTPTQYKTLYQSVFGSWSDGSVSQSFVVQAWDNVNGVPESSASSSLYNFLTDEFSYIECNGIAVTVSVHAATGESSAQATLDPTDPNCSAFGFVGPIVIDVIGSATDEFRASETSHGQINFSGVITRTSYVNNSFSANLTGTVGDNSGPWSGFANNGRNTRRERVN
jgi:hypothetical protein